MSSIEHIRSTPGYPHGRWPPPAGMTLEKNLDAPLADAVARWLDADWPWTRVDRCGR